MPRVYLSLAWLLPSLALGGCLSAGAPPPPAAYPFGAPPPAAAAASSVPVWPFMAGLGLGLGLAWLWRRRRLDQALRRPQGRFLPREVGRLRAVLAILDQIILAASRQDKVVRLRQWLREKGKGPPGRP